MRRRKILPLSKAPLEQQLKRYLLALSHLDLSSNKIGVHLKFVPPIQPLISDFSACSPHTARKMKPFRKA